MAEAAVADAWTVPEPVVHRTGWLVDQVLAAPRTARLVAAALDPAGEGAGATFDLLEPDDPGVLGAADLLAASLVGAPPSARAVRHLLDAAVARRVSAGLRTVPVTAELWVASDAVLDRAAELWSLLQEADGIGPVRATKLLARKRPRLVPLLDPAGAALIELTPGSTWAAVRAVLADAGRRDRIESLRPPGCDERIPLLRLFDLAMWTASSAGRRERTGTVPGPP
jgi:hypothetical protein